MPFVYKIALLFLTFILPVALHAQTIQSPDKLQPLAEHSRATAEIVTRLQHWHYQRNSVFLDDRLSALILDTYLKELDAERSYFLQSDIDEFNRLRDRMDDILKTGNLQPAFAIFNVFQLRLFDRLQYLQNSLDKGLDKIDFNANESLQFDREQAAWPKTVAELDELWRKRFKNDVLNLKLTGKDMPAIADLLRKRYTNRINQARQTKSEDVYNVFMNSFTASYDPHTQYLSPSAAENFNIQMRLSLDGIGAMLQMEDEYTRVMQVIPGGPADKAGQLKANDKIIGVGQGKDGEIIDVVGWRLNDVVDLIRGPKGTEVRLSILPGSAADTQQTKIITITRDKVSLEDRAASKQILEMEEYGKKYRIGVITLPKFYIDFEAAERGDKDYRSTTRDVKKLLRELVAEKVDGVVVDLRNNGGGALREVVDLVGLFIETGPTVQVRNTSGRVEIHDDRDPEIVYKGPLAVLVNRLSASASEIFAGAIQDYHRGIIIGTQTYGKGTVQAKMPLSYGEITLTQQKFYRITGDSTQSRGVIPDINLPSLYNVNEIGESALKGALPWDRIRSAKFEDWPEFANKIPRLVDLHKQRAPKDPDYVYLIKTSELIEKRNAKKELTLNEAARRAEKQNIENQQLALENDRRKSKGLKLIKSIDELDNKDEAPMDPEEGASREEMPLLTETSHILVDYISLSRQQFVNH
ncbi:MAG: carboxy terminal-processing peptidase [Gammaproteobacteria bacterium]|jgi:carboxyl-terminal processing protease|nr:carboxy terminal-processing peptidase [Gammaproteobacteria bacterium]